MLEKVNQYEICSQLQQLLILLEILSVASLSEFTSSLFWLAHCFTTVPILMIPRQAKFLPTVGALNPSVAPYGQSSLLQELGLDLSLEKRLP